MNYNDFYNEHRNLLELANGDQDIYWKAHDTFKQFLKTAVRNDEFILSLDAQQLIQFLAWCSSYRPQEPHVILTIFSQLANKI